MARLDVSVAPSDAEGWPCQGARHGLSHAIYSVERQVTQRDFKAGVPRERKWEEDEGRNKQPCLLSELARGRGLCTPVENNLGNPELSVLSPAKVVWTAVPLACPQPQTPRACLGGNAFLSRSLLVEIWFDLLGFLATRALQPALSVNCGHYFSRAWNQQVQRENPISL